MGNQALLEDSPGRCPDQLPDGSGNIKDCILCMPFLGTEDRGTEHSSYNELLWLYARVWKRTEVSRRHYDPLVSSKHHKRVKRLGF